MVKYDLINVDYINKEKIDKVYKDLLNNKNNFNILDFLGKYYVLTKEKSIFAIDNIQDFISDYEKNIFYKTIIIDEDMKINNIDLQLYYQYIDKYKDIMMKNMYGDKYIFGSVAVRSGDKFITTLRGKENLNDYTIVDKVDHRKHVVYVYKKKATLNAPLLDYLFKNRDIKVIVHINHKYDSNLVYDDYAIPGTELDTKRNFNTSFNIKYHGLIYLFDEKGNMR